MKTFVCFTCQIYIINKIYMANDYSFCSYICRNDYLINQEK